MSEAPRAFTTRMAMEPSQQLLTRTPMIMTHDSASGYLHTGLVNRWYATQSVGLREQLDCGARAFDARPLLSRDKGLIWHHAKTEINYSFAQSLRDVSLWAHDHPKELVLFLIWDCEGGSGCMPAVRATLNKQNVSSIAQCDELRGLTYAAALQRGRLPLGGSCPSTVACCPGPVT